MKQCLQRCAQRCNVAREKECSPKVESACSSTRLTTVRPFCQAKWCEKPSWSQTSQTTASEIGERTKPNMESSVSPSASDERSASPWTSLHSSILLNIYDHASILSKFALMATCKSFWNAGQAPSLWQSLSGTEEEQHLSLWCVTTCMAQSWKAGSGGIRQLNLIAWQRLRWGRACGC